MENETKRTGKRMEGLAVVDEDGEQLMEGSGGESVSSRKKLKME
jgi:hypothetical protein